MHTLSETMGYQGYITAPASQDIIKQMTKIPMIHATNRLHRKSFFSFVQHITMSLHMRLVSERVGKGVFLLQQAPLGIAAHIVRRFVIRDVDVVTSAWLCR